MKKIIKDQMKADRVELISAQHGQYDINDAWRTLAVGVCIGCFVFWRNARAWAI